MPCRQHPCLCQLVEGMEEMSYWNGWHFCSLRDWADSLKMEAQEIWLVLSLILTDLTGDCTSDLHYPLIQGHDISYNTALYCHY